MRLPPSGTPEHTAVVQQLDAKLDEAKAAFRRYVELQDEARAMIDAYEDEFDRAQLRHVWDRRSNPFIQALS